MDRPSGEGRTQRVKVAPRVRVALPSGPDAARVGTTSDPTPPTNLVPGESCSSIACTASLAQTVQ
jgi:hypothetical protein